MCAARHLLARLAACFLSGALAFVASSAPLPSSTFVAGVNVFRIPPSTVWIPNELLLVMSFQAIPLVAEPPRVNTPNELKLIPLWYRFVTAVLLMPDALVLAPQSV